MTLHDLLTEAANRLDGLEPQGGPIVDELRAAAEGMAKHVGWGLMNDDGSLFCLEPEPEPDDPDIDRIRPLYAAPPPAVPEGFVLAPVEPTDEMIDAGCKEHTCEQGDPWYSDRELSERDCIDIYRAMLAAAKEQDHE